MLAVIAEYGAFTGAQAAGPAGVSAHIGSCQALCVCRRVRVWRVRGDRQRRHYSCGKISLLLCILWECGVKLLP